jgi:hypothetical protein
MSEEDLREVFPFDIAMDNLEERFAIRKLALAIAQQQLEGADAAKQSFGGP